MGDAKAVSLTSDNLVGYLRAEFGKSGRIRVWLFFVQLLAAVPAAVSVVIPDHEKVLLYGLAVSGVVLLAGWWVLTRFYVSARSAAQAARRGALLLGGFNQPLSPSEIQSLRERFTVTSERARMREGGLLRHERAARRIGALQRAPATQERACHALHCTVFRAAVPRHRAREHPND
jgi:hypothetical protein